ncbi:hypothetical protein [Nostoc sp.]|uniref:hypothetical protein n=1 Tax=Nostoc sp. TaxID=1180 RepID=UPI002FF66223
MNRRLYKNQSFVLTAIYQIFALYNFHQKTLLNRTLLTFLLSSLPVFICCLILPEVYDNIRAIKKYCNLIDLP